MQDVLVATLLSTAFYGLSQCE